LIRRDVENEVRMPHYQKIAGPYSLV
jgi:hypothetical protein